MGYRTTKSQLKSFAAAKDAAYLRAKADMQTRESQGRLAEQRGLVRDLTTVLEKRDAEIKRLRAALTKICIIRDVNTPNGAWRSDLQNIARAALED